MMPQPSLGKVVDLLQHPDLVAEIQVGGGLVHDQDRRLLGQGVGDQHHLALSTTDLSVNPVFEKGDTENFQCFLGNCHVCLGRRADYT